MEKMTDFFQMFKRFWRKMHINQFLLLGISLFILITLIYFGYMASTANVQSLKDGLAQSTQIIDKDGAVASKVSANRTEGVSISEVPEHMKNAVIAIEDKRFYKHNGFDIKGIMRAFFKNIVSGRIAAGGSTITQQLTKNALLSPEKTYKRKMEEVFLAVEIEKQYEKEEILQMYLNQVYFGSGAWGVQKAAKKYFAKDIHEITLSEAALLAGMLKSPSALDPYKNYDGAIERRNVVLAQMKKLDMISEKQYQDAIAEEIVLQDGGGDPLQGKYPSYVDAVLEEAISIYGLTQDEILTRGYKIYTELDQAVQSSLENVYERDYLFPKGMGDELVQSSAVLTDPATGGVRAIVGGRGEHVFRGYNRATQLRRQPGSTMKPITVYAPALEEGYKPTSLLIDEPMTFGDYTPDNASKTYQGKVPMYKAIEDSINIPAVWLLNEIGVEKGVEATKKFGIPLEKEDEYLGLALGGMHKGVSPLRIVEAYSAFANDGKRNKSHFITKIVGPTGNVIAEHKQDEVKVTSKKVADQMTSMLLNVVETGTGKRAQVPGYEIAGKTGSTQLPYSDINGTSDQWFVGYTPNIVGAVWLGYDKTDRDHYLQGSSSDVVVPIFQAVMKEVLPHIEQSAFHVESINTKLNKDKEREEETEKKKEWFNEKVKKEAERWKKELQEGKEILEQEKGTFKEMKEKLKRKLKQLTN